MRLLLFNLATDSAHPLLGFATIWIRELARRCEAIDVLTMQAGAHDLPGNARVFSVGRELGWGRPRRLSRFYWLLTRLLAERRYHACFAHMTPLFAGLGGPLLRSRGIPITLWYTHRQRSRQLRLGMAMSRRVVSAHDTSFPYATASCASSGMASTPISMRRRLVPRPGMRPGAIKRWSCKWGGWRLSSIRRRPCEPSRARARTWHSWVARSPAPRRIMPSGCGSFAGNLI